MECTEAANWETSTMSLLVPKSQFATDVILTNIIDNHVRHRWPDMGERLTFRNLPRFFRWFVSAIV